MSLRLPRDKHDLDAVDAIAAAPERAVPLLPDLIGWMLDANWPVARALAPVVVHLGPALPPAVLDLLRGDDDDGKYHVLMLLRPHLTPEQFAAIKAELERIVSAPTPGERTAEVDEEAAYLLQTQREAEHADMPGHTAS